MIHYTILDPNVIFGQDYEFPELIQCKYMGESIEAFKKTKDTVVISRVISTNPSAYLNPLLQPGCELAMESLSR
jgi:hypothetical protein